MRSKEIRIRQNEFQKLRQTTVIRNIWLKLPEVSPILVRRLRRLYTQSMKQFLNRFKKGESTKQIYNDLRNHPKYSQLPANMLDRAGREAYFWYSKRQKERVITNNTFNSWSNWAKRRGIHHPIPKFGNSRIVSHSKYLKGYPGSQRGQWPQTGTGGTRFYIDEETKELVVTINRVAIKTRTVIGGVPKQLLFNAVQEQNGHKIGSPRLQVRDDEVYLAIPVKTAVSVPLIRSLNHPTLVGVDLGVNNLAAAVAITDYEKTHPVKIIRGKRLKHSISTLWGKRRTAARNQNSSLIQDLDSKIHRVITHWANVTAKAVIRYTLQFSEPIIVLEDLRSFQVIRQRTFWAKSNQRYILHKWARGKTTEAIQKGATLHGIPVIFVNAAYSSHVCPNGCLCLIPRKGEYFSQFHCPSCGLKISRDINAAIEIARRGFLQIPSIQ